MNEIRAEDRMAPPAPSPAQSHAAPSRRGRAAPRSPSIMGRLLRATLGLAALGIALGGLFAYGAWRHYGADLPDHARLRDYEPAVMSRVYAGDSRLLAELATERRIFVPLEAIPDVVRQAFVSAEDQNFWLHRGVDPIAIVRAAITNLQHWGQGRRPVGASTITQQVAKNMLLGNEVSITRKIREAILALRIEEALSKERVLELYLNEIYLGFQAYGVAAAAQAYFNKSLDELTLAEAAFLAALPKAPNNYNPFRQPDAARARRDWVLDRMAEDGAISRAEAEAAKAIPISPVPWRRPDPIVDGGFFAEEVRRQLIDRFGPETTTQGGLLVRTTLDPAMQVHADRALREGLMSWDRQRGGWRGPVGRIDAGAALRTEWMARLPDVPRPPGTLPAWRVAVVTEVANDQATVAWLERPAGRNVAPQPRLLPMLLGDSGWARPNQNGRLGAAPRRMADIVNAGDIVLIEPMPAQTAAANRPARAERALLRQMPVVEGALVALDPATGRVLALAGGWSFERSQFNRATQAQRQPGSSFKPFVYIAALEAGMGPGTMFLDAPFVVDTGNGGRWRPANFSNNFNGSVTMADALLRSLNLVTVRIADRVGLEHVAQAAGRFGVVDDMPRVFPATLGAVETTVLRQAAAYAAFANGGKRVQATLIDSVQDRSGRVLWRASGRSCAGCDDPTAPPALRDDRPWATDPVAAGQMVAMLQGAVAAGTGTRAGGGLGRPVGGKTGTTNDFLDNWFVGFTADLVVAVWVGFDTPTPLGGDSTGGATAAPIFRDFVGSALAGRPPVPFPPFVRPPGESFAHLRPPSDPTRGSAGPQPASLPPGSGRPGAAGLDAGLGGLY